MSNSDGDDKKDYMHDSETDFDQAMRKMEEWDARIERFEKSPMEEALDRINQQNELLGTHGLFESYGLSHAVASANEVAQAIAPLQGMLDHVSPNLSAALEPFASLGAGTVENLSVAMESMGSIISAISTAQSMAVSQPTVYDALDSLTRVLEPYNFYDFLEQSGIIAALETARTPELHSLHAHFSEGLGCGLMAMSHYVSSISSAWESAAGIADVAERSTQAANIAFLRLIPDYGGLKVPRGGKKVLHALTKRAAREVAKSENLQYDYRENNFYHESTPEYKVNAYQISVVESAVDLFADITFDELVQFESQLVYNYGVASKYPVGERIYEVIKGWDKLVNFRDITYYHARKLDREMPFGDHEMLKAPVNVNGHGRYNGIGRSCYYIAETRDGAVNEMKKHSGGQDIRVQVIGVKAVRSAKLLDLSAEPKSRNHFIEHMRFTVENEEGRYIKEYLLPNYVADCCKILGIDGIRYLSSDYCCIVLWKDDYFEFVDGTRDTIDCPA